MATVTFTAAELVRRAQQKFEDPKNEYCHQNADAALDAALLDMKILLDELYDQVAEALQNDPSVLPLPDYPDWSLLAERVKS